MGDEEAEVEGQEEKREAAVELGSAVPPPPATPPPSTPFRQSFPPMRAGEKRHRRWSITERYHK